MNIHLQGKVISQAKIYLFGNCLELKTPINDKDLNTESISFVSIFAWNVKGEYLIKGTFSI